MNSYSDYYKDKTNDIDNRWFSFTQIQFDWILKSLASRYKTHDPITVMDLGCGTGRLLNLIASQFPNAILHGVDGTSEMVLTTQKRLGHRANIITADLHDFQLNQSYDVIISTTVLHHLDHPASHLSLIKNGLTKNGNAYISEIALNTLPLRLANLWWSMTQDNHKQGWNQKAFQKILSDNGLMINDTVILKPDHFWRLQIYNCFA